MHLKVMIKEDNGFEAKTVTVLEAMHRYCDKSCEWMSTGKFCRLVGQPVKLKTTRGQAVRSGRCLDARDLFASTNPRKRAELFAAKDK